MERQYYKNKILDLLPAHRVIALVGSHGAGKTSVLNSVLSELPEDKVFIINKKKELNKFLSSPRIELRKLSKNYDYLVVDTDTKLFENDINQIINSFSKKIFLVLTYDITSNKINNNQEFEKLYIHPFTLKELYKKFDEAKPKINYHLIYGFYPQVLEAKDKKEKIFTLSDILEANLKDEVADHLGLEFKILLNVLKFLALNVGKNLSFQALTTNLNLDKTQVRHYLNFLERRFIIFTMKSFSRSLPKEMSKAQKFYFWDTGIRNLLVNSFDEINLRNDFEQIWENFCISERLKRNHIMFYNAKNFFWKTYDHKEIPYLEENYGFLFAYTFSWKKTKTSSYPRQFINAYQNAVYSVINIDKLWDFLS